MLFRHTRRACRATVRRGKNDKSQKAMLAEGEQILGKLQADEQVVLLDERGKQMTSKGLADRLSDWQSDGRDVCLVIGGPDGVSDAVKQRANFTWSLSQLTLPHGLARVLLAESASFASRTNCVRHSVARTEKAQ